MTQKDKMELSGNLQRGTEAAVCVLVLVPFLPEEGHYDYIRRMGQANTRRDTGLS